MGHPIVKNKTPFAFETLFLADENGQQLLVPVVKATYQIRVDGLLTIAENQTPVNPSGEYWGESAIASYKYEPETAFIKTATDVVLIGHACAPHVGATQVDIELRVARMKKVVRVFGDRFWLKSANTMHMTSPLSFERIALIYEHAFGGLDCSDADPGMHAFDSRNPLGTGFVKNPERLAAPLRLPNLEDPRRLIQNITDQPNPAGFGFIAPHWQPRAALAGTYDKTWIEQRMPLLPTDFDRRYFNAAPTDQVVPGYLIGNEPVEITNTLPGSKLGFNLPGLHPPRCRVTLRNGGPQILTSQLDTVIINTDEKLLFLIWRANLALKNGPHDVLVVDISVD